MKGVIIIWLLVIIAIMFVGTYVNGAIDERVNADQASQTITHSSTLKVKTANPQLTVSAGRLQGGD